jgi:hypothetical protein
VERFALRFRTDIEPFYSMFYINEQQRLLELQVRPRPDLLDRTPHACAHA